MPFSNPGFEYALSDGWSTLGSVSREGVDSTFAASSGFYYARLTSSGASRSDIETFLGASFNSEYTVGSAIRQTIQVTAGQTLSFDWKFFDNEGDSGYYDDAAFVISGPNKEILSSVSVAGATQEGRYEYTFESSGDFVVGVAVFNASDSAVDAALKVDDFSLDGSLQILSQTHEITDAGSTLTYLEGEAAKVIEPSITISDEDDSTIESATVSISSGFQSSEDLLGFADSSAITGSWDASTGVLTLTGSASKAQYEQALQTITYTNTNTDHPNTTSRTISWVVNNGDSNSSAVTSTINVVRVNDAPLAESRTLTFQEDHAYIFSPSDFGFKDVDAGDILKAIRITGSPSSGQLYFNGATFNIGDEGYSILASDINKLEFIPAPNDNGQEYSVFSFKVLDQSDAQSESAALTINIDPVNDFPVVTNGSAELVGEVIEVGHNVADGTPLIGASVITGQLSAENVDQENGDELVWSIIGNRTDEFGEISINPSSGEWTYTLDNEKTSVKSLLKGDVETSSFVARVVDQDGLNMDQTIDITIRGSDDLIRQYADHIVAFSSAGQHNQGDRWAATQALGEPDTTQYGDIDTAWSPNRRNGSGGNQPDEFLTVGFRRPVKAAGFVIHENYGSGFVRRVDAVDLVGNTHPLWQGQDNSPNNLTGFSISLNEPTDYLVTGLKVWVDIDQTADWEEIDAIELIGWAAKETYLPSAPTLNLVAENDVINSAEKAAGVMLVGQAEANSIVEIEWGGFLHTASVGLDRNWSLLIPSENIPSDVSNSSIRLLAIDSEGYRSSPYNRSVRISTAAPALPEIAVVAGDNRINTYERSVGVVLEGLAHGCVQVDIDWDGKSYSAHVNNNGSWSVLIDGPNGTGVIPNDSVNSKLSVVGIDVDGNRSDPSELQLLIDSSNPDAPSLATVSTDNIISAAEKSQGVTLNGLAEFGTTVQLQWGGRTYTALANSSGNWSVSLPSTAVPDDALRSSITMRAVDVAGNQSILKRARVAIDTIAPVNPVILPLSNDDILNSTEISQSINLSGTAESDSLVEVYWNGHAFSTTTSGRGHWNLEVNPELLPANGSNTAITASAVDAAGNRSGTTDRTILIDAAPPNAPFLNTVGHSDVVNAALESSGFMMSGQAETGTNIRLKWERFEKEITVPDSGEWSVPITESEVPQDGTTSVSLTAVDQAGNTSTSLTHSIAVDTDPPSTPKLAAKIAGDGVLTATEREGGLAIRGTTEAGTLVDVTFAGLTRTAVVTGTRWEVWFEKIEIPVAENHKQAVGIVARDTAGNVSVERTTEVALQTAPPASPLINAVNSSSRVNADDILGGFVISGQAEDRVDHIELTWGQMTHLVPVSSRGRWSLKIVDSDVPTEANSTLTAVALTGVVRSAPSTQTIAIDTVAPSAPTLNAIGQTSVVSAAIKSAGLSLSGQAEAGSTINLSWGRLTKQTSTSAEGLWSLHVPTPDIPQDGLTTISLTAVDHHGNRSSAAVQNVSIDSVAPDAPLLNSVTEDNVINAFERASGIKITGRAEAGSSLTITIGEVTRNILAPSSGRWSLELAKNDLPSSGLTTFVSVVATDAVGNQSEETRKQVDLAFNPASAPTINPIAVDNIVNIIESRALMLEGTGEVGSHIDVTLGSTTEKTTVDKSGRWRLSLNGNQIPSIDGYYELMATATNRSGLASVAANRSVIIDRRVPELVSATIEGGSLILEFSEAINASALNANRFSINAGGTALPVQSVRTDPATPTQLFVEFASSPGAETELSVNYEPAQQPARIADLADNSLPRLRGISPSTFRSALDVTALSVGYRTLKLTGSDSVQASGNRMDNVIVGNIGDNVISCGVGSDLLTGLGGRDRFVFTSLGDSVLGQAGQQRFDRITDYVIGTDVIDGPSAVARGQVSMLTSVKVLDSASLTAVLTTAQFKANGAAVFSMNSSSPQRWFIALNDSVSGFDPARDAIVEITGFTGQTSDLQIL